MFQFEFICHAVRHYYTSDFFLCIVHQTSEFEHLERLSAFSQTNAFVEHGSSIAQKDNDAQYYKEWHGQNQK